MVYSKKLLLIGFGSIGLTHFKKASKLFDDITVIDIDERKRRDVLLLGKLMGIKSRFLTDIKQIHGRELFDLIVIANWGPDHIQTYREVSNLSWSFLIEKPLVSKLKDLRELRKQSCHGKIIIANHQWLYSGFHQKVLDMQVNYDLGPLSGIQVFGGSRCLVTNGVHFLAMASQLFSHYPSSVYSIINPLKINPRGENFNYYGGVSVWNYATGGQLSVHFQLASNVSETARILFQNGFLQIEDGNMEVYAISVEDREKLAKPSWTIRPNKTSKIFSSFSYSSGRDGLDEIYRKFSENSFSLNDFDPGYHSTLGILASLHSSKEEQVVNISDFERIDDDSSQYDWKIT